ncbi:MAG: guanylate kinase [Pseudomonadales bacterium]
MSAVSGTAVEPDSGAGMLIIVSAPSGAGKTSLVAALLERDPRLVVSVSHTTRNRRPRERAGVDYHFVDTARFGAMIDAGEFLEHAEVFGNRYGTTAAAVDAERAGGRDVILEIDFQGAAQVRARYPDAVSIFVLPPSRATLANRLTQRGEDDAGVIRQRLDKARWEMSHYRDYDFLVVNDAFEVALGDLECIVRAQRLRLARQQQRLGALLEDLLRDP